MLYFRVYAHTPGVPLLKINGLLAREPLVAQLSDVSWWPQSGWQLDEMTSCHIFVVAFLALSVDHFVFVAGSSDKATSFRQRIDAC